MADQLSPEEYRKLLRSLGKLGPVRNINYLKQVMKHPCAAGGPEIIIKTAFEAALPVLFSVNQFSCLDILKTRAGISWKCGRQLKGIIEAAHGPKIVNRGHFFYHLGPALGEKALWWWFVADLATGFIADWTSLMYQESGCAGPESTHFTVDVHSLMLDPGGPYQVLIDAHDRGECATSRSNQITVPPGCTATISYAIQWAPFRADLDPNAVVTSWLEDQHGTQYMPIDTTWKRSDKEENAFSAVTTLKSGFADEHRYRIMYRIHKGLCGVNFGHVSVTTTGRRVEVFPVGCKPKPTSVPNWIPGFANPAY